MTYKHQNKIKSHTYVFSDDNICPLISKRHIYTLHISFICRITFNAHVHVMYYKPPNTRIQCINVSCTPVQRKSLQNTVDDCIHV